MRIRVAVMLAPTAMLLAVPAMAQNAPAPTTTQTNGQNDRDERAAPRRGGAWGGNGILIAAGAGLAALAGIVALTSEDSNKAPVSP